MDLSAAVKPKAAIEGNWKDAATAMDQTYETFKYILLYYVVRIVGLFSIAVAVCKLFGGHMQPVYAWCGAGVFLLVLPTLIDTVFGCMLPR
jgi:hypothetical protein